MSTSLGVDILVSLVDRLARPLRDAENTVAAASERMNRRLRLSMQVAGAGAAAAGVAYGARRMVTSFTDSIRDVEQARGELATLGVRDLDLIVARGREMQAEWAGVTSAAFVGAAYDIRSGISDLTDQGVADMTAAATVVARATRSEVANMTSLFAGAYGIFRRQFDDMTDSEWGDMFGAALSAAVQQFRTDGAAMQQAIQSAGAGATNLGMRMTEQMALLGMMQGQMQAGEAGTALAAFARNAFRAQEAFAGLDGTRVRLIDENGQLRAMPDILADLTARYGETLEAEEAFEIQQALGSDEAMRLVNALYGQEAAVRANEAALADAADQGAAYSEAMAGARDAENRLSGLDRMAQGINVLWQSIGERLLPVVDRIIPYIEAFTASTLAWVDANPELVTQIGTVVVAIGAIAAAAAPVLIALGGIIASWAVMSYGATRAGLMLAGLVRWVWRTGRALLWVGRAVLPLVTRALLFMGRALLANPIGLAVAAIAGAAYLIWQNWEPVSAWFAGLWSDVTDIFGGVGDLLGGVFTGDMARARAGIEAIWNGLQGFFQRIWDGIGGIFTYAYETWIRPVLDALGITDQVEAAWGAMTGFFSGVLGDIGTYFSGLGEVVAGILTGDMERARAGAQTAWEGFSGFLDRILNGIGAIFTFVWENVIRPVTDALGLTEPLTAAWGAVQTAFDTVLQGIGGIFTRMWGIVEPVISALSTPEGVGAAWQAVRAVLTAPLDWIGERFNWLMERIQPVLDALQWTLDNGAAAVAAMGLGGEDASVMDNPDVMAATDGRAPSAASATPPALSGGSTPYTSIPTAMDILNATQTRARGGAFGPGWLLTGEDGPELEYRNEGGFIAHNGALRGMMAMAARTRALMSGLDMGSIATRAMPALATVAGAAGSPRLRGPVTLNPTYNMPLSFAPGVDIEEVRATVQDAMQEAEERAQAALRSVLYD